MSQVIVDDELWAKLKLDEGGADLCDSDGKVVGYVMTVEEHKRFVYDILRHFADTPESLAQQELAREQIRRGEVLTTAQLWQSLRDAGIDTDLR